MTTKMLLSLLLHCFYVTTASSPGGGAGAGASVGVGMGALGGERPYFDDVSPRNVTAVVGQAAVLRCRAKHIGNRTVSWMRKRDLHILTSHIFTYTGDARFSVLHPEPSDDWDLKVDYVQPRDAGVYECQINTEPKINMAVVLTVEAAAATIWGSQDVYVKKGSTISLTCSVNVHSSPPSSASVLWYHGTSVVDFDSPRGGISLETEKTEGGTTSKLLVTKAALTDSGNYTCVPSNAHPASVAVHVLNGEHPAAMQTSNRASSYLTSPLGCALLTYLLSSVACR
ncbi:protein sidekick-2-like isoform X2 [Leptidea sinapis]|uniref:protein sidekick-2-like isoform X2 n=1 Tax=Leptidea sinapis TaxID=189913 RepID=UPI0021C3ED69|nr:protein sidekick-2-like isoform X2 [Leptidea sinapis]